ncbi:fibronectin type III domain-containing protein [Flavobacterium microcysteis]|uniref:Fibronectin type-III domain-containing protein n=1 Tax=Flavobacterium microcysteis TaxID=2596891 RepID=A0A501QEV6_9FLAO|nr:hypothetical protein [Flavobacterium microcysteis]TPD70711.1 hypothetical protein FJA49_07145 [Flavobacterium microcysteis]
MNKLKFLAAFALIFTAFNFSSCDNEPLDSAIDPNPQPSGCVAPTSFQASNFIGTNVNLSWAASTGATSWEVQYGPTGFAIGSGTSVFSETTNVTIPGLVTTNTYHFYVRSNCSESEVSSWIGPISVGTSTGGNTSGDYWPTAINNQWTYSMNGTTNPPLKMIGTANFGGRTYYKFSPQSGSGGSSGATGVTTWLNKNNGVYNLKTDDMTINAGGMTGTQTGFEYIILKDNIAVNATWTGTYSQTTSLTGLPGMVQTVNYVGKILEKDATATVNGQNFTNVIKVSIRREISILGMITIADEEYWFSKNVGVIKSILSNEGETFESILVNYTVN